MHTFTDPSLASIFSLMAVEAVEAAVTMVAEESLGDMTITEPKVSPKTPKYAISLSFSVVK